MIEHTRGHRISIARFFASTAAAGITLVGAAGIVGPSDAARATADVAAQADQIAAGSQVFANICSKCHGDAGQGGDGPTLIGPGSAAADYRNAKRLFDFLSTSMPDDDPGSLGAQQYYDVIAFILSRNGWNAAGQPISPSTAESVALN